MKPKSNSKAKPKSVAKSPATPKPKKKLRVAASHAGPRSIVISLGNPGPLILQGLSENSDVLCFDLKVRLESNSRTFEDPTIDKQAILDSLRRYSKDFFELVVKPAIVNELLPPASVPGEVTAASFLASRRIDPDQDLSEELWISRIAKCRIHVTMQPPKISLGPKIFAKVKADGAMLVDLLIRARGRLVTKKVMQKHIGPSVRPSRVIADLPEEIQELIHTSEIGHRLEQAAWLD